jgi:ParB family chromosome partitioning protein
MAKKSSLGNNFDSIFDDFDLLNADAAAVANGGTLSVLKIGDIEPNREQPRRNFDNEQLNALAGSIAEHGIIQPLTVRPFGESYQIVAGERRWRAARIAGLSEVPVRIMELSDLQTMQIALIENLQREDLNPIEEAAGYHLLIERFGMKQDDVAKKIGKARSTVTNALRLLNLPAEVRDFVIEGSLSRGHCKVLMSLSDDKIIIDTAKKAIKENMSVAALEKYVKLISEQDKSPKEPPKPRTVNVFFEEVKLALGNIIGKPVRIVPGENKITLEIDLSNADELRDAANVIARIMGDSSTAESEDSK